MREQPREILPGILGGCPPSSAVLPEDAGDQLVGIALVPPEANGCLAASVVGPDEEREAAGTAVDDLGHAQTFGGDGGELAPGQEDELAAQAIRNPEQQLVEQQSTAAVASAVEGLRDELRSLVHDRYWNGREMDDIAREQGVSGSTIRRRQPEALDELRKTLDGKGWSGVA